MVVEYRPTQTEHFRDRMATVWKLEPDSDGDGEDHGGGCRLDEGARAPVKVERKGSVAMLVYHIRILCFAFRVMRTCRRHNYCSAYVLCL